MLDGTLRLWLRRIVLVVALAVNSLLSRSLQGELLWLAGIWQEGESCLRDKAQQLPILPKELPFLLQQARILELIIHRRLVLSLTQQPQLVI